MGVLSSCVTSPAPSVRGFVLYHLSNRHGEIEPCGCQANQVGGLDRLVTFLGREPRDFPRLFVDAGDTFFSMVPVNPRRLEQETLRALLIARTYKKQGLEFLTPGERDFAAGKEILKRLEMESGAQFLAANLTDSTGQLIYPAYRLIEKGGMKIGIVGVVDEGAFSNIAEVKVQPAIFSLRKVIGEVGRKVDFWVVLSHLGLERDRVLALEVGKAIIVGSHSMDLLQPAEQVGECWLGQTKNEGQQVGKFSVTPSGIRPELVDLGKEYEEENETRRSLLAYREQVKALEIDAAARADKIPPLESAFVANRFTCRTCHLKQFEFWQRTRHASAYLTLYSKNQHFNSDCIGCHTLGFQDKRGFQLAADPLVGKGITLDEVLKNKGRNYRHDLKSWHDQGKVEKVFMDVQCEHCHGNRAGHPNPNVKTLKKVSLDTCRSCHRPPNAPQFDPKMLAKVACPLSSR